MGENFICIQKNRFSMNFWMFLHGFFVDKAVTGSCVPRESVVIEANLLLKNDIFHLPSLLSGSLNE